MRSILLLFLHFPMAGLLLCLRVIIVNAVLITSYNPGQKGWIVRGDLVKFLSDVETLLLLISCQKSHQATYRIPNKIT
jgi:hypothetical protein